MKVEDATFGGASSEVGSYPRFGLPEIAFVGRSNSGKSSALNCLCGRRSLANTGRKPGRTRQINFFLVSGKLKIVFADLPGYGYAKVSRSLRESWRALAEDYLRCRQELCGVVVVIDARRGLQAEEELLLDYLRSLDRRTLLLATKTDKLRPRESDKFLPGLTALGAIPFSAQTGTGVRQAWDRIRSWVEAQKKGGRICQR